MSKKQEIKDRILAHYKTMKPGDVRVYKGMDNVELIEACVKELIDSGYDLELASDYKTTQKFRRY